MIQSGLDCCLLRSSQLLLVFTYVDQLAEGQDAVGRDVSGCVLPVTHKVLDRKTMLFLLGLSSLLLVNKTWTVTSIAEMRHFRCEDFALMCLKSKSGFGCGTGSTRRRRQDKKRLSIFIFTDVTERILLVLDFNKRILDPYRE